MITFRRALCQLTLKNFQGPKEKTTYLEKTIQDLLGLARGSGGASSTGMMRVFQHPDEDWMNHQRAQAPPKGSNSTSQKVLYWYSMG